MTHRVIPKIILGTGGTYDLIRYLYSVGRANTHTDPHLVASWNGFAPDPGRDPARSVSRLAAQLDLPVNALRPDQRPKTTIWHCPVRAAPGDRDLTDAEWAAIAHRIVAAAGLTPTGDDKACRWVAVRHADDHIHIAATLIRQDGRRPQRDYDKRKVQAEARQIEKDYGLRRLKPGDGTAAKRPTSAEQYKADRKGQQATTRESLRTKVRQAVAAATGEAEFFALLDGLGIDVKQRILPSGDIGGYSVALPGDTNAKREPIWFSGSTLAPDLSLPKIRQRLTATDPHPAPATTNGHASQTRPANPWHQATAAIDRIPDILDRHDDTHAQAHIAALGEAIDVTAAIAPPHIRPHLQQAANLFERATRSRIQPDHHQARALRNATRQLLRTTTHGEDGGATAMLLSAVVLAAIAVAHWHESKNHAQQHTAAQQVAAHLTTAYQRTAAAPLADLRALKPTPDKARRYEAHLRNTVSDHADRIVTSPAWEALTATLAAAESAGHNPADILHQAAKQRELDTAHSPAEVLTWRIHRLGHRTAPSPRALAARTRTQADATKRPSLPSAAPRRATDAEGPRRRR